MPNAQRLLLKLMSKLPGGLLIKMSGQPQIEIRGRKLDPMMQMLWVEGKKQPSIKEVPPPLGRKAMDDAAGLLAGPIPAGVTISNRSIPSEGSEIALRLYSPKNAKSLPVVLFFHQGGFVIGGLDTCHSFCALLAAEAGCVVINVDYRLAPEHTFPAPVEDAFAAYRWTRDHAAEIGGDPKRLIVCGDSAGGMLAALVSQHAQKRGLPLPVCQILIYPWLVPFSGLPSYTDFADAYPLTADLMVWFSSHYFTNEAQKADPLASPGEAKPLAGQPTTIIAAAGFDPLSDEAGAYAERLRNAGVKVTYRCFEHLPHSFCMMGLVPSALAAQRQIVADLRSSLA